MPSIGRGGQSAQIAAAQAAESAQRAHEAAQAAQRAHEEAQAAEEARRADTTSGTGTTQGGGVPIEPTRYAAVDITRYIAEDRPLDITNPNNPEYHVYNDNEERRGWLSSLKGLAKRVSDYTKGSDNFDVLMALADGQEVRATKSLLNDKVDLYKLPENKAGRYTWGALKKLWNEGYVTGYSDKQNALKIAEAAPRILVEKAMKVFEEFDERRTDPTRQAAAVLADEEFEDRGALREVLEKLQTLFRDYKEQMAIFKLDPSQDGDQSTMNKVKAVIDEMIAENFDQLGDLKAREESKVVQLKASLIGYFDGMNNIAHSMDAEETPLSAPLDENLTPYQLKEKINRSVDVLFNLAINNQREIEALRRSVDGFENLRHPVRI